MEASKNKGNEKIYNVLNANHNDIVITKNLLVTEIMPL